MLRTIVILAALLFGAGPASAQETPAECTALALVECWWPDARQALTRSGYAGSKTTATPTKSVAVLKPKQAAFTSFVNTMTFTRWIYIDSDDGATVHYDADVDLSEAAAVAGHLGQIQLYWSAGPAAQVAFSWAYGLNAGHEIQILDENTTVMLDVPRGFVMLQWQGTNDANILVSVVAN